MTHSPAFKLGSLFLKTTRRLNDVDSLNSARVRSLARWSSSRLSTMPVQTPRPRAERVVLSKRPYFLSDLSAQLALQCVSARCRPPPRVGLLVRNVFRFRQRQRYTQTNRHSLVASPKSWRIRNASQNNALARA